MQNLSVPFDRRVWLECQSLVGAGFEVAVVCPKAPGDPTYSRLNGVELYKYRPYAPGGSSVSFVIEYVYSFLATLVLSLRASLRGRFAVVQSCNPPDLFWPIGLLFRLLHGSVLRLRPSRPLSGAVSNLASRTGTSSSTERCDSWSGAPCGPRTT